MDHGFEVAFGPWWVLAGFVWGIVMNVGRRIGDISCAWRLSYSPAGPAFGIWGVIYLWTFASIVLQLAHGYLAPTYIGEPQSNYLIGGAWALVGVWGRVFGVGADEDKPGTIGVAASVLAAATLLAVTAVAVEQSWRSGNVAKIVGVGVPYALFAGWLAVATVLNASIAYVAATTAPDTRCTRGRYKDRLLTEPIESSAWSRYVPLSVAVAVSIVAFLMPDPVLVVPVLWGIYNMRRTLQNWVAMEVLVVTCVATSVQVATERWVIRDVK
jgi:hypothetical protein